VPVRGRARSGPRNDVMYTSQTMHGCHTEHVTPPCRRQHAIQERTSTAVRRTRQLVHHVTAQAAASTPCGTAGPMCTALRQHRAMQGTPACTPGSQASYPRDATAAAAQVHGSAWHSYHESMTHTAMQHCRHQHASAMPTHATRSTQRTFAHRVLVDNPPQ
jgi:hypothetical protein